MLLSVLIPVYNEEKTISQLLKKVIDVQLPKKIIKEIVIVDDGSTDRTVKVVENVLKKQKEISKVRFVVKNHLKNRGKGAAIRSAINHASGDVLVIQDADLEYDPNDYIRLMEPILKEEAKVVFGTRLKNYPLKLWGENKTVLPSHWVANKVLTGLTNILYGTQITDMETCYKMFKKEVINGIKLTSNRFDIEPEITSKILLSGHKIHEVEIKTTPRTHKEGKKIKWTDGIAAVWTLFKFRFKL